MKRCKDILVAALVACSSAGLAQHETAVEQMGSMAEKGIENFQWGLLLEGEGSYSKAGDTSESDLILATVEFTADAAVSEWLSGHVGLLWEEDSTDPMALDEGFITIGTAFYAQAGKYYLPVGNFESAFISDPLTLELAEINQSSVMAGYGHELFDVSLGAFKGTDESTVQNFYAAANFNIGAVAVIGAYFLSDLLETDGLADLNTLAGVSKESGAGAFANLYLGSVMINAEFVSALSDYTFFGNDYTPMAYNLEASVNFAEKWVAGLKYEGSKDLWAGFDDLDAPTTLDGMFYEQGFGAVVSYGFHEHAVIGAEYLRLSSDGEDDADLITVQLAFEI